LLLIHFFKNFTGQQYNTDRSHIISGNLKLIDLISIVFFFINRYLFIDTTGDSFDELVLSNELLAQEYYLGIQAVPYRFLVINFHYFTLFLIFFFGKYLHKKKHKCLS